MPLRCNLSYLVFFAPVIRDFAQPFLVNFIHTGAFAGQATAIITGDMKSAPYAQEPHDDTLLIRRARIEAGLTLEELASEIDCTPQTLQRYESGVRRISLDRLLDIARALGKPPGQLIRGGDGLSDDERDMIAYMRENPREGGVIRSTYKSLRESAKPDT